MKKRILIKLFLVLAFLQANAQFVELGGSNSLNANGEIKTMCFDNLGNVYAAGVFATPTGRYVAKYNGTTWSELGGTGSLGANGAIWSICSDNLNNIYAAGEFKNVFGKYYVAKYNGTSWSELGGVNSLQANGRIFSIYCDSNGNIYATGESVNSQGHLYVAKFDGTSWSELGGANNPLFFNGQQYQLIGDNNGNIYVSGYDTNSLPPYSMVKKFNGTSWSNFASSNEIPGGDVWAMHCDASNNLYLGGNWDYGQNYTSILKYNGAAWDSIGSLSSLGLGIMWVLSITSDLNGNIYAAATGNNISAIKYDGNTWTELTSNANFNGEINVIKCDQQNRVYCAGGFSNSSFSNYVAVYDPATLGLSEHAANTDYLIYPNPFTTKLNIKRLNNNKKEELSVKIKNTLGQNVIDKKLGSYDTSIQLESIPDKGIYFIEILDSSGNLKLKEKIIKD